jgi:hypothetical protein
MRFEIVDVAGMRLAGLGHRGPYERIRERTSRCFLDSLRSAWTSTLGSRS